MIIYKITNRINGKIYIGQTIRTLRKRWWYHCNRPSCPALHSAIQKYGKENFTVEQIDVACDREELNKKEIYWISYYNSVNITSLSSCLKGRLKRAGGYHWKYADSI